MTMMMMMIMMMIMMMMMMMIIIHNTGLRETNPLLFQLDLSLQNNTLDTRVDLKFSPSNTISFHLE